VDPAYIRAEIPEIVAAGPAAGVLWNTRIPRPNEAVNHAIAIHAKKIL
jgi:hypothetical protein